MIDPKELRIGNFVEYNDGTLVCTICTIDQCGITADFGSNDWD